MVEERHSDSALRATATSLQANGHFQRALDIYLFLVAKGIDVGVRIAECCEAMGRLTEARYWAAQAAERHPEAIEPQRMAARLGGIDLKAITGPFEDTWDSGATKQQFDETQGFLSGIPGGETLLNWFGGTASFHDAEVLGLHLDREGESRLDLLTRRRGPNAVVTFILADWIDVTLAGFSRQNVIGDLIFRQPGIRSIEVWERGVGVAPGQFEIELTPCYGANGLIRASIKRIELAAVPPA